MQVFPYIYYYYYLAGCTMFHIFLRPFDNYNIFFLQLPMSFQSSSINPFSPISPLITSAQVRLDLPRPQLHMQQKQGV
jgi:hypothetical protein